MENKYKEKKKKRATFFSEEISLSGNFQQVFGPPLKNGLQQSDLAKASDLTKTCWSSIVILSSLGSQEDTRDRFIENFCRHKINICGWLYLFRKNFIKYLVQITLDVLIYFFVCVHVFVFFLKMYCSFMHFCRKVVVLTLYSTYIQ